MTHLLRHTYYYEATHGPHRNGVIRQKEEIMPTLISDETSFGDLLSMAEGVIDWGTERWANDHGSYEDHLALINFVNVTIAKLQRWEGDY